MSEHGDELTPLPDQADETPSRSPRAPYLALGVAAVVVSTVFATVASLAGSGEDNAAPPPVNRGSVETTDWDTSYPATTTTSPPASSSSAPSSSPSSTTTTTTTTTTTEDDEPNEPSTPGNTQTPRPTTTTPPPPANKPPSASIGGGCPETGTQCAFTGSGSSDPEGGALRYSWDFGDGSTSSGADPGHTYAPGSYTVTLTVTDNKGLSDTTSMDVTVVAPPTTSSN